MQIRELLQDAERLKTEITADRRVLHQTRKRGRICRRRRPM